MTNRSFLAGSIAIQDAIQREGLVINVGIALQARIDRELDSSKPFHPDAVAGIIDDGDICISGTVGKVTQRALGLGRRGDRGGN